jgi:hypothetical protein
MVVAAQGVTLASRRHHPADRLLDAAGRARTEEEFAMSGATVRSVHEEAPAAPSIGPLTRDFLAWVARRPRTYAETMEAWRTSCPRFTIWEDAIGDDLVRVESAAGVTLSQTMVVLTPRGRATLDGARFDDTSIR